MTGPADQPERPGLSALVRHAEKLAETNRPSDCLNTLIRRQISTPCYKRVFDLVKDFGTSVSPKSTRSSTTIIASAALRALRCDTSRWFASQDNSHKWLDAIVGCLLCFPFGAQGHVAQKVQPNRFRGLTAFASLSLAVSERTKRFLQLTVRCA
jgi:hypothetical protein